MQTHMANTAWHHLALSYLSIKRGNGSRVLDTHQNDDIVPAGAVGCNMSNLFMRLSHRHPFALTTDTNPNPSLTPFMSWLLNQVCEMHEAPNSKALIS